MSYTCSPEGAEAFWLGICSGTDASEPLNESPIVSESCLLGSETESSHDSPSSAMCGSSMVDPFRGRADIVAGGFPCRPYSSASRGRPVEDDLWPEMFRIVADVAPGYVFAENVQRRAIDRAQMLRIAKLTKNRQARMAVRMAFYSGMRLGEIMRAVPIGNRWHLADTKNSEPRIVPIHPSVAVCARHFKAPAKITIQKNVKKACKAAGMPWLHFHDLRHSAASELVNNDVDLFTVGAILGHKDQRSTARYSHLATRKLEDAIGKIGQNSPTTTLKRVA
jgi:hypothetical protein